MPYDKKCFSLKVCKKGKKPWNQQQKKTEKSEKEKDEAKWKQSKKSIKEICQGNYEKKRFIQSFKPREILKLKIKIKNIQ